MSVNKLNTNRWEPLSARAIDMSGEFGATWIETEVVARHRRKGRLKRFRLRGNWVDALGVEQSRDIIHIKPVAPFDASEFPS